ncbi:methyltransferase [Micromonospora sp. WMMA1363]|uniref:methyltransferase n=1 Tax=Micromonospora sp. WMMA1363 TaxID=3053985 RepID=UPI00259D1B29|nr:methyltransferase [Micromonospora sp. WMMA1363]MDM4718170.1 methyltransferase [Micromonospora sp. WMMA1363]
MTDTVTASPARLLRLGNAFCEAQALLTAVELDLFRALWDAPATAGEIRDRLGLSGRGLHDFLSLLVALDLLHVEDGRYGNADDVDRFLTGRGPRDVTGFLRGAKANLYPVWNGLTETLRTGRPRTPADDFAGMLADPAGVRRYAHMMDGALRPLLPRLLAAVDWLAYGSVLDVGGCRGSLVGQLALAHPHLAGHVFDLPQLAPVFAEHMTELGTADRVTFHAGDFFADPLPPADVVVFGHILHNWRPRQREELVRAGYRAVRPGGVLLVHDRMLDEATPRVDNLVASLIMALVTEEGSEYPVGELAAYARAAGFTSVRRRPLDDNETLVTCHRAA